MMPPILRPGSLVMLRVPGQLLNVAMSLLVVPVLAPGGVDEPVPQLPDSIQLPSVAL